MHYPAPGGTEMNKTFIAAISALLFIICFSSSGAAQIHTVLPAVTGPIVKGTSACNTDYGWKLAKYNNRESCVFCDERSGWSYAKYDGKDACVRCDERNGWVYDGKKFCIRKNK
jgi:hypothetical protein